MKERLISTRLEKNTKQTKLYFYEKNIWFKLQEILSLFFKGIYSTILYLKEISKSLNLSKWFSFKNKAHIINWFDKKNGRKKTGLIGYRVPKLRRIEIYGGFTLKNTPNFFGRARAYYEFVSSMGFCVFAIAFLDIFFDIINFLDPEKNMNFSGLKFILIFCSMFFIVFRSVIKLFNTDTISGSGGKIVILAFFAAIYFVVNVAKYDNNRSNTKILNNGVSCTISNDKMKEILDYYKINASKGIEVKITFNNARNIFIDTRKNISCQITNKR